MKARQERADKASPQQVAASEAELLGTLHSHLACLLHPPCCAGSRRSTGRIGGERVGEGRELRQRAGLELSRACTESAVLGIEASCP